MIIGTIGIVASLTYPNEIKHPALVLDITPTVSSKIVISAAPKPTVSTPPKPKPAAVIQPSIFVPATLAQVPTPVQPMPVPVSPPVIEPTPPVQPPISTPRKKIIEYGWDVPNTAFIHAHIQEMEKQPFDGVIFRAGIYPITYTAFDTKPWDEKAMRFDLLATIPWKKFTDNFLILYSSIESSGAVDWFDDAKWQVIATNMKLHAKAAKTARAVGIALDTEAYGVSAWKFNDHFPNKTFAEAQTIVRKRGAQWLSAIQTEFSNPKILAFHSMSAVRMLTSDSAARIPNTGYALWPAFLEGMLSVAGPQTIIIDGNEISYGYTKAADFMTGRDRVYHLPTGFIDPAYQQQYKDKVQTAMAIYADGIFKKGGTERLQQNVYYGLQAADEYLWIYSEKMDWWRSSGGAPFAGLADGIITARDLYLNDKPFSFNE